MKTLFVFLVFILSGCLGARSISEWVRHDHLNSCLQQDIFDDDTMLMLRSIAINDYYADFEVNDKLLIIEMVGDMGTYNIYINNKHNSKRYIINILESDLHVDSADASDLFSEVIITNLFERNRSSVARISNTVNQVLGTGKLYASVYTDKHDERMTIYCFEINFGRSILNDHTVGW